MTTKTGDFGQTQGNARNALLALARCEDSEAFIRFATGLAKRLGLALDYIQGCNEPPASPAECFAIGPAACADVLDLRGARIEQATAVARRNFDAAVAQIGLAARWTAVSDLYAEDEVWRRAQNAAFVLLSRPKPPHTAQSLVEDILLRIVAPVLIVPPAPAQTITFSRILCAWDGSSQARRALNASMPLLRRASTVELVQVGASAAGQAPGDSLDAIADELATDGIKVEAVCLDRESAGIAATLLERYAQSHSELLVMGAYRHRRLREQILGGVTRTMLERADIPILLAH